MNKELVSIEIRFDRAVVSFDTDEGCVVEELALDGEDYDFSD